MISKYVREQHRYTQEELRDIFESSSEETIKIARKLKEYGVLKNVKKTDEQSSLTDLAEVDIEVTDIEDGEKELYYVFSFVGVIVVYGRVLKCYPKYIFSNSEPKDEMKQVLRVLERYNSKEQLIHLYNESDNGGSFNLLAVMLFLLQDFYEYGAYTNEVNIIETNGSGEILWDKTINETFSFISDGRPYYTDLQTKKRVSDEYDYFRRLHECILTQFSKELEDSDLPDLFNIATVELSEEELNDFGDEDYILYRLQNELSVQYNTRKQLVLKAIYAYIAKKVSFTDIDSFSLFGSNSFNLVWERVCAENFKSYLDTPICNLPHKNHIDVSGRKEKLIDLIEKPKWRYKDTEYVTEAKETLIPDLISIYQLTDGSHCFAILDAKYYLVQIKKHSVTGQPGVGDITKQYLYQLAYEQFIEEMQYEHVQNAFLFPSEKEEAEVIGAAEMQIMANASPDKLEHISAVKLPAKRMYEEYLNGGEKEGYVSILADLKMRSVVKRDFTSRMTAYISLVHRPKEQEKIVYPTNIRFDVGAKMIFDQLYEASLGDTSAEKLAEDIRNMRDAYIEGLGQTEVTREKTNKWLIEYVAKLNMIFAQEKVNEVAEMLYLFYGAA